MKKKVVRKLMALALVSAMATSMLAGCGSGDDSGKDSGKDADKGSEETVLKVAAFEGGNGTQIWEDIAKAFEESHDGVKVELEMSPELDKDLTKAIQNGDVPDVVYYNLGQPSGFTETMLKEEAIADISGWYPGWYRCTAIRRRKDLSGTDFLHTDRILVQCDIGR